MIFLTVGTQLPFDRLVRYVDGWAGEQQNVPIFAQIGSGSYRPANLDHRPFLTPQEHLVRACQASVIVAHAGMGSILNALELGKPIIILPRRADLREHRNDHQMATAKRVADRPNVLLAIDEEQLRSHLNRWKDLIDTDERLSGASESLIATIRDLIVSR